MAEFGGTFVNAHFTASPSKVRATGTGVAIMCVLWGRGERGTEGEGRDLQVIRITHLKVLKACAYNALSVWTTRCHIAGTLINTVTVIVCVSWRTDAAVSIWQVVAGGSIQTGV